MSHLIADVWQQSGICLLTDLQFSWVPMTSISCPLGIVLSVLPTFIHTTSTFTRDTEEFFGLSLLDSSCSLVKKVMMFLVATQATCHDLYDVLLLSWTEIGYVHPSIASRVGLEIQLMISDIEGHTEGSMQVNNWIQVNCNISLPSSTAHRLADQSKIPISMSLNWLALTQTQSNISITHLMTKSQPRIHNYDTVSHLLLSIWLSRTSAIETR